MSQTNVQVQTALTSLLREEGLLGLVIARRDGEELLRLGDLRNMKWTGMQGLFGSREDIRRMGDSLEGQLLPQIWAQGEDWCAASLVPPNFLWGAFATGKCEFMERYESGKRIAAVLEEMLPLGWPQG